jgi:hypothetical protein
MPTALHATCSTGGPSRDTQLPCLSPLLHALRALCRRHAVVSRGVEAQLVHSIPSSARSLSLAATEGAERVPPWPRAQSRARHRRSRCTHCHCFAFLPCIPLCVPHRMLTHLMPPKLRCHPQHDTKGASSKICKCSSEINMKLASAQIIPM